MTRKTERCEQRDPCSVDSTADSAGGITFDTAGAAVAPGAVLLLRRRGLHGAYEDVRLPLTPGDGGRSRAVLPSTVELAEGQWDVLWGATGRAAASGLRDVRALVGRVPEPGAVAVRLPYAGRDGSLAVRSWVRAPHAEAGEISTLRGALAVEGVLYGAETGPGAAVEARLRGGDAVRRVPVTCRDGAFTFTLPYAQLRAAGAGGGQWWDLWLVPGRGPAARVSRILDDAWDKRCWVLGPGHRAEGLTAAPHYTEDNGLSVRLDPVGVSAFAP
jgi:hypothetical protein